MVDVCITAIRRLSGLTLLTEIGFADALPLTFYSDLVEDSRELDYSLGLHYNWLKHWGKVKSVLKAGATWKADGNVGEGEYYEDPSLAANGYRPRPYKDYPYMHNAACYIEDNLTLLPSRPTVLPSAMRPG